jgi:hypothetical protein
MEASAPLSHDDYTVGWVCAMPVEIAAVKLMLDKIHPPLPRLPMDQNTYTLGNIGEHNIIVAPWLHSHYIWTQNFDRAREVFSSPQT